MYLNANIFICSQDGHFVVYFPSCETAREINTKITLEWAHEQFITRVHTLFLFLFISQIVKQQGK